MIELFILETCYYSHKVMDYLDANNIEYIKRNIEEKDNYDKLIKLGGKNQVPFMVDGNNMMYESSDIINYARENYVLQ